jgi:hypothetical protein
MRNIEPFFQSHLARRHGNGSEFVKSQFSVYEQDIQDEDLGDNMSEDLLHDGEEEQVAAAESSESEEESDAGIREPYNQTQIR